MQFKVHLLFKYKLVDNLEPYLINLTHEIQPIDQIDHQILAININSL